MKLYEVTVCMEVLADSPLHADMTVENALNKAANMQLLRHIEYFDVHNVELLDEDEDDAYQDS